MRQNKLFNRTRVSLALWYSSVIAVIFGILGYGVYRAIAHAHLVTLDRELESIANTFHNSLEVKLDRPGEISSLVWRLLPDLCLKGSPCFTPPVPPGADNRCQNEAPIAPSRPDPPSHHLFKFIGKGEYYLRLLDLAGCPVALAGAPPPFRFSPAPSSWRTVSDESGARYHEITVHLHTTSGRDWGYLQVGRSFEDLDEYLATVRQVLWLGLPIALGSVGLSSWWLAGLAMRPIYRSYQQIQQFTADAAHELRTPLAATGATLEAAMRQPEIEGGEVRELFGVLYRQNQRLTSLVRDLLLLSRLEHRSGSFPARWCCLNEIAADLVEEFAALAIASEIELELVDRTEQSVYIQGDADQLYRLFSNLIVNAIQYTPAGGRVLVIVESTGNEAIMRVSDTGIGIKRECLERIFDRFYRAQSDRSRQTGGSGLGLAIVQALVHAHRGKIEVKSEVGTGSVFTVRLLRHFLRVSDS
jgi:signal transduction histidine kinase